MGVFGYFGGTEKGTWGARIKILRPLFNTNTPPKTPSDLFVQVYPVLKIITFALTPLNSKMKVPSENTRRAFEGDLHTVCKASNLEMARILKKSNSPKKKRKVKVVVDDDSDEIFSVRIP